MSAVQEVKTILQSLANQDMTVHNLGDEVWDVCEQMQAAIADLEAELVAAREMVDALARDTAELEDKDRENYAAWERDMAVWKADRDYAKRAEAELEKLRLGVYRCEPFDNMPGQTFAAWGAGLEVELEALKFVVSFVDSQEWELAVKAARGWRSGKKGT